jgi:hypothetical protein
MSGPNYNNPYLWMSICNSHFSRIFDQVGHPFHLDNHMSAEWKWITAANFQESHQSAPILAKF